MLVIEAMRRPLVSVTPETTLGEAARTMADQGVGALIVVGNDGRVAGIVTDRDLVVRAMAKEIPLDARVDMVMTTDVVTLDVSSDLRAAYPLFRRHAVRRLPIVDDGKPMGVISTDDLVMDISADLADVARPITGEVIFGHHEPDVPSVR
ncbi:MAG TPA: CBS domain-containing protein [Acidimicrobiia bacterium]|nr:CBS domain-containing protein [Acidimicrobiia bacterium]